MMGTQFQEQHLVEEVQRGIQEGGLVCRTLDSPGSLGKRGG